MMFGGHLMEEEETKEEEEESESCKHIDSSENYNKIIIIETAVHVGWTAAPRTDSKATKHVLAKVKVPHPWRHVSEPKWQLRFQAACKQQVGREYQT